VRPGETKEQKVKLTQTSMSRAVVLVLLAAAVVGTSAAQAAQPRDRAGSSRSARPVAGYSSQELMALSISHPWVPGFQARSRAQAKKISLQELTAIANSHPHVSASHVRDLMATADNSIPSAMVSPTNVEKSVTARSGGFDWGDAGIGATTGFALALVLAGSLLFLVRRRSRGQGASTPQTA
jgi:hypothetical protein